MYKEIVNKLQKPGSYEGALNIFEVTKAPGFRIAIRDLRFATRFQVFTNHFSRKTKEIMIRKTKQVQI